jgi:hypothetical protein
MPAPVNSPNIPRPPASIPNVRPAGTDIAGTIQRAATSTGASFDYLLATAKVESNLDPSLTMRTSTATGLFQFLEQTWLGAMKTAGHAFGFDRYADAISQSASGQYVVDDPALRDEMMELRKDPAANALMGGVVTQQNAAVVASRIGRKPTEGELYVAHFFGPYAGSKVIELATSNPNANAAAMFPAAASANRSIFYDRQGNARTIAGVYNELIRRYQVAKDRPTPGLTQVAATAMLAPVAPKPEPSRVAPVGAPVRTQSVITPVVDTVAVTNAIAAARGDAPRLPAIRQTDEAAQRPPSVFHSLFETDERRGAVSPVVTEFWGGSAGRVGTEPVARGAAPPGRPLDLFQDQPPAVRALFKGDG